MRTTTGSRTIVQQQERPSKQWLKANKPKTCSTSTTPHHPTTANNQLVLLPQPSSIQHRPLLTCSQVPQVILLTTLCRYSGTQGSVQELLRLRQVNHKHRHISMCWVDCRLVRNQCRLRLQLRLQCYRLFRRYPRRSLSNSKRRRMICWVCSRSSRRIVDCVW